MPEIDATHRRQILQATERVVASQVLGTGERLPTLLRYLVRAQIDSEAEGNATRIKAYTIGVDVFGRGADFDPQTDSIVRVEMGRLRKALELYNATHGKDDAIKISFAAGTYLPNIVVHSESTEIVDESQFIDARGQSGMRFGILAGLGALALCLAAAYLSGYLPLRTPSEPLPPRIAILPVAVVPEGADQGLFATGLQLEIAAQMARQTWLSVIVPTGGQSAAVFERKTTKATDYELDSRLRLAEKNYELTVFLKAARDQSVAWTATYSGALINQQTTQLISGLAATIAAQTGQAGGAITQLQIANVRPEQSASTPQLVDQQFLCMLEVRRYWHTFLPTHLSSSQDCLTRLNDINGGFSDGRSALAMLAIDAARNSTGNERMQHLSKASKLLDLTVPGEVLPLHARMALAACLGDTAGVVTTAEALATREPNDPAVLADVGSKLGLSAGLWQRGVAKEMRALELNPRPAPWYPLSSVVKAMIDGKPQAALNILSRVPQRDFATGHALFMAIGGALGDADITRAAQKRLSELGYGESERVAQLIRQQCWLPQTQAIVLSGLTSAAKLINRP
jgi:adenylate cyclase